MANVVFRGGVGVLLGREGSVVVGRRRSLCGHESFAFPGGHGLRLSAQQNGQLRYRRRTKGPTSRGAQCIFTPVTELGSMALAMEWQPAIEQLMLMSSVALAYIAGVATPAKPSSPGGSFGLPLWRGRAPTVKERVPSQEHSNWKRSEEANAEGSESRACGTDAWSAIQAKLAPAVSRSARNEGVSEASNSKEGPIRSPVLSLQAIDTGPRLRLLAYSIEHLRKEVFGISEASRLLSPAEWSKLSLGILCQCVEPIGRTWLRLEPCLQTSHLNQRWGPGLVEMNSVTEELNGSKEVVISSENVNARRSIREGRDLVLDYLQRSGKADLYTDLMFFLRFKTIRIGSCCDQRVMTKHVGSLLEDLIVAVADGVASMYLGRSSVMGGLEENGWPILVRSSILSTRALERIRNEVALRSWLQQNFSSVVAMFEDRYELWTIQKRPITEGTTTKGGRSKEQASQAKCKDTSDELKLTRIELPARRSKELKGLTGWRYCYSLYLEFSDIVGPLLQVLASKIGTAVSFLLVSLIGRSLGLIYQGIRQSLRWSSK